MRTNTNTTHQAERAAILERVRTTADDYRALTWHGDAHAARITDQMEQAWTDARRARFSIAQISAAADTPAEIIAHHLRPTN